MLQLSLLLNIATYLWSSARLYHTCQTPPLFPSSEAAGCPASETNLAYFSTGHTLVTATDTAMARRRKHWTRLSRSSSRSSSPCSGQLYGRPTSSGFGARRRLSAWNQIWDSEYRKWKGWVVGRTSRVTTSRVSTGT